MAEVKATTKQSKKTLNKVYKYIIKYMKYIYIINYKNALYTAVEKNNSEIVQVLLTNQKIDANIRSIFINFY